MSEPFTIRIFVPDGDPEGVKIVEHLNWTGGLAFPRSAWPRLRKRDEFGRAGVYILTGTAEGADDELPTVYVGQAEEIGTLGENAWHAIRIGGGMLSRIKYIAAYQSTPIRAITHYAPVKQIEPYGDEGKYRVVFTEAAKPIGPIPFADATTGSMQGAQYTSYKKLLSAKKISDLFD